MLEINRDLLAIDDQIDSLVRAILDTSEARTYRQAKNALQADHALQADIEVFLKLQTAYEEQQAYAKFRPDIAQLKRKLLAQKRQIDMALSMQNFRQAEVALQEVLADVAVKISQAISPDIFVDTGLPLAPHRRRHGHGAGENIREKG
ncbi:YlbF family regulator [Streptococcus dentapri]|uniref:YlbF family regulator n=1 Tax=Streptococcus dentapri TaxID=573564 RepID=A0ABV8D074_9STRE